MRQTLSSITTAIGAMFLALSCYADSPADNNPGDDTGCYPCSLHEQARLFSDQSVRLGNKLDRVLPGRPGQTDMYFLGFAGNGDEPVFANEVRFAEKRVAEWYSTGGRSAVLASNIENIESEPLATTHNLFRAISEVGARMDVEDDILFLFLTSHGWKDATLQVSLGELPLDQLRAADLRKALDDAGIRWRVLVISACYSGSFIEPLKDRRTIIMTAASAQNVSYGCEPVNDLTDFGKALFEDALGTGGGLLEDFRIARSIIAKREKLVGLEPSKPQTYVGFDMEKKLRQQSDSL